MKYVFQIIIIALIYSCANITTPTGGPKDIRPPELLNSIPLNKQTNFKGKSVELIFDEGVKINNPKEEIIISPSPGKEIEFKVKGTMVTITPELGWQDTTTYSILFREGIQDITEGNSPVNLKIAFSTGPNIDSMRISGKVEDLLKGIPIEKITVAIYSQDTFNLFTHTPGYFTKTNKSGRFNLENIKVGRYKIYAFEDKNKNLKVESRTERFGFISDTLFLNKNIDSLSIGLIMLDSRPLKISSIRSTGLITKLRFNKYISDYKIDYDTNLTKAFGDNQTEINIWYPAGLTDSLKIHMSATDSLEMKIDSAFYIKKTSRSINETFKWSLGDPRVDSETGSFSTILKFNKPISNINFDSLFIELDSINRVKILKQDISIDEPHKEIHISKELDKNIFKDEKEPELNLSAGIGFVYSIDNDTSKRLSEKITIFWPETTGILIVQIQTNEKNFIIQLLNSQGKIVNGLYNTPKFTFKNLNPEEYQIRIIIDTNKNGKWDPGNIKLNREPEKVIFYTTSDGKKKFPIRANWELGPLILKF